MKLLQLLACAGYLAMAIGYFMIATDPTEQLATLVILAVSFFVMASRAVYAWWHGLWKYGVSWAAEALKPERTAVVTLGIVILVAAVGLVGGFDPPKGDNAVGILVALFLTGGLFAALITSPHNLIELAQRKKTSR